MNARKVHVMVDIETTGTDNDAGILTLAAVPFWWGEPLPSFYEKCAMKDLEEYKFVFDRATMDWWLQQDVAVRAEAFSGTQSIVAMLTLFTNYIHSLPAEPLIWGNGADFDNVIITSAYDRLGMRLPWSFRNNRCFRTLKNAFPGIVYPYAGGRHNALVDADNQARHAIEIFNAMEAAGFIPCT